MKGFFGLIIIDNEIKNTTQIMQEVAPGEKYLVSFLNPPAFARVCNIEEIQQWLLFPTQEQGTAWIEGNKQQAMDLPSGATPPPPAGDSESIKKALEEGKDAAKN